MPPGLITGGRIVVGRIPRHHLAGDWLWRRHHRHGQHGRGKALLGWAAPLGRMAFTNYLAQSVIFGWIFYGYGFGLFGRLGVASALTIGIAVYVGQVVFSAWWLKSFRYGPVEWLWRTLMYGSAQPMSILPRRQTAAALTPPAPSSPCRDRTSPRSRCPADPAW